MTAIVPKKAGDARASNICSDPQRGELRDFAVVSMVVFGAGRLLYLCRMHFAEAWVFEQCEVGMCSAGRGRCDVLLRGRQWCVMEGSAAG